MPPPHRPAFPFHWFDDVEDRIDRDDAATSGRNFKQVIDIWFLSNTLVALMNMPPCRSVGGPQDCDPLFCHVPLPADLWRPWRPSATLRNRPNTTSRLMH